MRMRNNRIILVSILVSVCTIAHAETKIENIVLPRIKLMPDMKAEWAAERMIYNGTPMSIRNYRTNRTGEEVMQFYSSAWKSELLAVVSKTRVDDEWVIGYGKDNYYYSVQVKNDGKGSVGSLVVTSSKYLEKKTEFPIFPGANVLTSIHNLDHGVHAETIILGSRGSMSSVMGWYDSELKRAGWVKQERDGMVSPKLMFDEYQKKNQQCQLRAIPASQLKGFTAVVQIIWIKG